MIETPNKIHRLHAVMERTGIPRSSLYALIKQGQFPTPISLGKKAVGWLESDIQEWVNKQIAQRDERLSFLARKRGKK